jgi:hypothetical protein
MSKFAHRIIFVIGLAEDIACRWDKTITIVSVKIGLCVEDRIKTARSRVNAEVNYPDP